MEDSFFESWCQNGVLLCFAGAGVQWPSAAQGAGTAAGDRPFHPVLIWGLFSLEAAEGKPRGESATIAENYTSAMQQHPLDLLFFH